MQLMQEMALWEFLELLEVNQTAIHPVFGLPSKLIAPSNAAEFVSQGQIFIFNYGREVSIRVSNLHCEFVP